MISYCVVIYKNGEVLLNMMKSLEPFIELGDEILIQDNCPSFGDENIVSSFQEASRLDVKYVKSEANQGFAKACNNLAELAKNQRLIFLNPDTETQSFNRDKHVGETMIGPVVRNFSGGLETTSGYRRNVREEIRMRWLRLGPKQILGKPLLYISGVAISVSRDLFLQLGGFDERYFMYYEDIDLGIRANKIGVSPVLEPSWNIKHIGGSSAKKIKSESLKRSYRSSLEFHRKWNNAAEVYVWFSKADAILRIFYSVIMRDKKSTSSYLEVLRYMNKSRDTDISQEINC